MDVSVATVVDARPSPDTPGHLDATEPIPMRITPARTAIAAAAVGLVLAGCATDDATDAAADETTTATESAPLIADTEYRTIGEFKDAAVEAGLECDDFTEATDLPETTWQQGTCGDVTLSLYRAQEDKDTTTAAYEGDDTVLVGPNWTVVGPQDAIDTVQPGLGGEVA
ncbi:hypothetical protein [Paraoerskovia marina]|uniref:hypothetical protein n=1 Tax=Paraoerskovia marina TaxID=545619 RepID=UPI0012FA101B|nr:hypothetical protein [Paraoerskovia marina]